MNFSTSFRIILFFIFIGLFTASFQIGATTELSREDALAILTEFTDTMEDIDSVGIFLNNLSIGLPNFIPGAGPAWGLYSGWSTGISLSGIYSMYPELSDTNPLDIFYVSPFGFLELIAYAIGMSRGTFLIFSFVKRHSINSILKWTGIEIGIVIALLGIGGVMVKSMMKPLLKELNF